ncbi:hypothetical protein [Polluticoccus soli]|uniref:hypothetical protein n=1 Tax=Polluticoccus soli TaxID=3034150 RepID=UPI0023E1FF41|nr:hypothetical protein [Flavipsychrobacter sp. JY13-12]
MLRNSRPKKDKADRNNNDTPTAMPDRRAFLIAQARLQQGQDQGREIQDVSKQNNGTSPAGRTFRSIGNALMGVVVAFFPKCPVCWAGYMSLFGAIGLQSIPYTPQVLFLFIAGMAVNLYIQYRICRRNHRMRAFVLNLVGVTAVVCGYLSGLVIISYCGIALLIVSSLFINLRWPGLSKKIHQYARLFTA